MRFFARFTLGFSRLGNNVNKVWRRRRSSKSVCEYWYLWNRANHWDWYGFVIPTRNPVGWILVAIVLSNWREGLLFWPISIFSLSSPLWTPAGESAFYPGQKVRADRFSKRFQGSAAAKLSKDSPSRSPRRLAASAPRVRRAIGYVALALDLWLKDILGLQLPFD